MVKGNIYMSMFGKKYNGPLPKGYVIHHKDENHQNYDISNLECLTRREHYFRHKEKIDISKLKNRTKKRD